MQETERQTIFFAAVDHFIYNKYRPSAAPALVPSNSICSTALLPTATVFGLAPGCVYPSMITESVMVGRAEAG